MARTLWDPDPALLALSERLPPTERQVIVDKARSRARPVRSLARDAISYLLEHVDDSERHDLVIDTLRALLDRGSALLVADTLANAPCPRAAFRG